MTQTFYSHGKLLITGEYLVLDGAKSLAIPTTFGQSLEITKNGTNKIYWTSYDHEHKLWFEAEFDVQNGFIESLSDDTEIHIRLLEILNTIQSLKPNFLNSGLNISTRLTFPRNWGLGTSSTLINNLASWANINPHILLEKTFGGSGYDIACAQNHKPITYQLRNSIPEVNQVDFYPNFSENLYFLFLNEKQNSREGIAHYRSFKGDKLQALKHIEQITEKMLICENLDEFCKLMEIHETLLSNILGIEPVKGRLFYDFNGSIKSLGAWGGDFVLIASHKNPTTYFKEKGYPIIIPFDEMIYKN